MLSPLLLRLRRTVGWWGLFGLLIAVAGGWAIAGVGVSESQSAANLWRAIAVAVLSVTVVVARWGRQSRPSRTDRWQDVVGPLVSSREEFCLVLRPFGADGSIITEALPGRGTLPRQVGQLAVTATLEQIVAGRARSVLGLRTFALVDQRQLLAPAGPVWLRAELDDWREPVEALILRAHSIVVVLPPGQQLRAALKWEISRIRRHHRQHRVIVVLPPPDRDEAAHRASVLQAALVLAALEDPFGDVDAVDPGRRDAHLAQLGSWGVLARLSPTGPRCWEAVPARRTRIGTGTYAAGLGEALSLIDGELRTRDFAGRYPPPSSSGLPR